MAKKTKTNPYKQTVTITEKVANVKNQIEKILIDSKMALAPIVILTGDKIVSRVDVVSTEPMLK